MASIVTINGYNFNLKSYFVSQDLFHVEVTGTTFEDLKDAISNGDGTITIGSEFEGYGYTKKEYIMAKEEEGVEIFTAELSKPTLEQLVDQHTEDIDILNEAVMELSELIDPVEEVE